MAGILADWQRPPVRLARPLKANEHAVRSLEKALELARNGEIQRVAISGACPGRRTRTWLAGRGDPADIVFGLEVIKHEIIAAQFDE